MAEARSSLGPRPTSRAAAERAKRERTTVVADDARERVADDKGDVGFHGGKRPDRSGPHEGAEAKERGRPRDTGRQGS